MPATKVKLTKGFVHHGVPLHEGDEFEGDTQEIAALVRQGYADAPKEEEPEKQPKPVTKVTLKKGFEHNGHSYKKGDVFEGDPEEIAALVRQGYADDPNKGNTPTDGPGRGYDVSASAHGSAGASFGQAQEAARHKMEQQGSGHHQKP